MDQQASGNQVNFMNVACFQSKNSRDRNTKVGACIVNCKNKIIGRGFNRMPKECDDEFPSDREGPYHETKYAYVCHAEMNAIVDAGSTRLEGCSIYVTLFPCNECAKWIIETGIRRVFYWEDKYHDDPPFIASRRLLNAAFVKFEQLDPSTQAQADN